MVLPLLSLTVTGAVQLSVTFAALVVPLTVTHFVFASVALSAAAVAELSSVTEAGVPLVVYCRVFVPAVLSDQVPLTVKVAVRGEPETMPLTLLSVYTCGSVA